MRIPVIVFFTIFLLIGIAIFRDYGVHWDEFNNQEAGNRWGSYVINSISSGFRASAPAETPYDAQHGVIFEILLFFATKILLKFTDSRDIILARHLLTFLSFYIGAVFFYHLCKLYFKSRGIALLGCLFLILHPRIFSHSFYNSVDIPFLSLYIIGAYAAITYLEEKTFIRAFLAALASSFLINIRTVGIILPLGIFALAALDLLKSGGDRKKISGIIKSIFVYVILLAILILMFWPFLWQNPIGNFIKAVRTARFHRNMPSPWYYNFKYIGITTPLLYSICFLAGIFVSTRELFKNPPGPEPYNRNVLMAVFLFVIPIILPIMGRSYLYDEWRHHYFIYPIFVIFLLAGLIAILKLVKIKFSQINRKVIRTTLITIIVSNLFYVACLMVKHHPYQYVYANILGGKELQSAKVGNALDYWGLSYRNALEYILKNDSKDIIKVCAHNLPGETNARILLPEERKRLVYTGRDYKEAEYFVGNYREKINLNDNIWSGKDLPLEEYYSLKINETKFMVVYRLKAQK